jgi:hypothetical protein
MEGVMEIVPAYNFIKFRNLAAEALRIVCWALACAWIETNLHQLVWQLICLTITFYLDEHCSKQHVPYCYAASY